ncbi:BlaI/MecI/CopY family transcriptional regulator [Mycolicibacterium sp. Y3]
MARLQRLGNLERSVMDHLWDNTEPQTVRQVHDAVCTRRRLAYTTIMTVLQRLATKDLVIQIRDDRAFRYTPLGTRDELVAALMVDALDEVADRRDRQAALIHFIGQVGADEIEALRGALADIAIRNAANGEVSRAPIELALPERTAS